MLSVLLPQREQIDGELEAPEDDRDGDIKGQSRDGHICFSKCAGSRECGSFLARLASERL
jgi:hypothetical protein